MTDQTGALALLQHADSFFPAGGFAFSWGLETLAAEGRVRGAGDVARFIEGQMTWRWATTDRIAVAHAHRAAGDLDRLAALDAIVDTSALPRLLREGSRRAGNALLGVHDRLGTPGAAGYRARVRRGLGIGHGPIVQGLVWRGAGLDEASALAASAHQASVGLAAAALRLGLVGHLDAQRALAQLRPALARLIGLPVADEFRPSAFTPGAEIAMMRHERRDARLFAN